MKNFLTVCFMILSCGNTNAGVVWDESINGDLFFNQFTLSEGTNTFNIVDTFGRKDGASLPDAPFGNIENGDDRFRVEIGEGFKLTSVSISIYSFDVVTDILGSLIDNRTNIFINEVPSFVNVLSAQSNPVSIATLVSATSPVDMFSDSSLNFGAGLYQIQPTAASPSWSDGSSADFKVLSKYAINIEVSSISSVPVPAAVWFFGSGLVGLVGMRRKSVKLSGK